MSAGISLTEIGAAIPGPVLVVRADGHLVSINQEAEKLLSANGTDLPVEDLIPEFRFPDQGEHSFDAELQRRDGSVVPATISCRKFAFDDEEYGVVTIRDRSDDVELERARLEDSRRLADTERITGRGSWVWDIGSNTVTWSDQLYRVFGFEPGEVEPSYEGYIERIHPQERDAVVNRIRAALESGKSWQDTKLATKADGSSFYLATQGDVITDAAGKPTQMLGVCGDVTDEIEAERASAQLQALVESSHDAIVVQDLQGRIIAWSPGAVRVFGHAADEVIGRQPQEFVEPGDYDDTQAVIDRIHAGESNGAQHDGMRSRADGTRFPVSTITSPVKSENGRLVGTACIIRDISGRQATAESPEAEIDPVTGLVSRSGFVNLVDAALLTGGGTLLRFDLDNFRLVNERYGMTGGDRVLRSIATTIGRQLSPGDVLSRLGGDEFAVFVPGSPADRVACLARETLEMVRGFVEPIDGVPVSTTASVGATNRELAATASVDELLAEADRALMESKAHGRDRYSVFKPVDGDPKMDWYDWGARIRSALAENRLELFLQPIVSVSDRKTVMHEVLVRMRENGELLRPDVFLGTAEHLGLIHEIDRTVVRKSVDLLGENPGLRLSVNLSGKSIDDESLLESLRTQLIAGTIDPGQLVFEVTETSAIVDVETARRFSLELRELGCDFALDDFGTGFGSFAYLKRVPSRYLKIDGDFVAPPRSQTDEVVIDAVVSLARALGKTTVAEHVEDEESFELIASAGVDLAQGYHFGRPLPVEEALARQYG